MGGLVGVDVGVLDDGLGQRPGQPVDQRSAERRRRQRPPVEVEVEVAGAFDRHPLDAGREGQGRGDLGRDVARLAPQGTGQMEGRRRRQIAQIAPGRGLEHRGVLDREALGDHPADLGDDGGLERAQHGGGV